MGTPFTSARNGLWDASDVDTWGQGLGVYPQTAGDVVNIGHTVTDLPGESRSPRLQAKASAFYIDI